MKRFSLLFYLLLSIPLLVPCVAWSGDWDLSINNWGFEREVRMRPRYDYNPSHEYRGTWERGGRMTLRPRFNYDLSKRLRGYVDPNGYGRLRDWRGNTYRVRPKY